MNASAKSQPVRVAVVLGTRPEAIKLMPLLRELARRSPALKPVLIATSQHTDLLTPLFHVLGMKVDHQLDVQRTGQSLDQLLGALLCALDPVLDRVRPDVIVVQGDTTSALAGALAGFHRRLEVVHVEAGLRSGNPASPFPEEVNRRLITTLATRHMAATKRNVTALLDERVPPDRIVLAGNTVVDAARIMLAECPPSAALAAMLDQARDRRLIVLTTHRRENFGPTMAGHLSALGKFVDGHEDLCVVFPVHPNPAVRTAIAEVFESPDRVRFVPPMLYPDFLHLLRAAWLIVSDSGGIQEEAVTLGKPIIVLRDTTERPEVLECGLGQLAGHDAKRLSQMLAGFYAGRRGPMASEAGQNPFGDGHAAARIADAIEAIFRPTRILAGLPQMPSSVP